MTTTTRTTTSELPLATPRSHHDSQRFRQLTGHLGAPYHAAVVQQSTQPAASDGQPRDEAAIARYQIGEVADRTGVTQRTLRFYEEKGLLRPPERMDGGFRLYSDADVERISSIRNMQSLLGLSLAEIKEMVEADELRAQIRATFRPDRELPARLERIGIIRDALQRQLAIVDHKLEALSDMRRELGERLANVEERQRLITEAIETGVPFEDPPTAL